MATSNEEELLRSVALRNARSILIARERAEDALRKQSEWLRITLASIGDAVISTDAESRVTFLNGVAESLTGWPQAEALGQPLPAVFHIINEGTGQSVEDPAIRALREGTIVGLANHTVLIARDGTERPIDDSAAPMCDESGASIGAVLIFRDVTERKRAEVERERLLREVEAGRERLFEVFRRSPSFMAILRGTEHRFELANDRYNQLVGHRSIIGKPAREALPEIAGQGFLELLDRVYRTGEAYASAEMRVMVQREPGRPLEERYIEFVYQPLRDPDGSVSGILAQGIDLTDRKRAEAAVRQRDERLRLFLENATDYAVIITDVEGRILEWKGGAEQITGWREDEIVGTMADVIFTPEDRAAGAPEEEMRKAVENGRAEDKRWHMRNDGSRFFGDGVLTSLRGAAGELQGFGKVLRDVTDRKRAEEALREADRRKDEFIALLAHELRNPLAPIRNGLQVMRLADDDSDAVAQARAMMDRQLGHMVRLIDDLLDMSRISQNKMELRRARVLLADVVANAVETARPVIEAAGHELTVSLPSSPILLDADLTRLAQVLSNLLTNSAKYTERGGQIWLEARRLGDEVEVSVRDTGIGIPTDALHHVFDMFSQVDRSIERTSGGLGIGLALVKSLVEMHGGTVSAESVGHGAGSVFTVRLPALRTVNEPLPSAAPEDDRPADGPKRRILVVDDNQDAARTMSRVLTLLGNEVHTAHDGIEAVNAAEAFRPEVILMDVGMPRMNGYEAARRIREQGWGRSAIIIALTGWGQEGDRVRSRDAGCDGHLVKPVDLLDLEKLLDQLVKRSNGEDGSGGPTP